MAVRFEQFREALLDPAFRDEIGLEISDDNAQALLGNEEWASNYFLTWHAMTHETLEPGPSYEVRAHPAPTPPALDWNYQPPAQLHYPRPQPKLSLVPIVVTALAIVVGSWLFLFTGFYLYTVGSAVWMAKDGRTGFIPTEDPATKTALIAELMTAAGLPSEEDLLAAGWTTGDIQVQQGNLFETANLVCKSGADAPGLKQSFVEGFTAFDESLSVQAENVWVVIVDYCTSG